MASIEFHFVLLSLSLQAAHFAYRCGVGRYGYMPGISGETFTATRHSLAGGQPQTAKHAPTEPAQAGRWYATPTSLLYSLAEYY
ncbi:hypothetical protein [Microbulbifer discodermiae]|uniref:hypothetical protein n=1 Tax=Microbulbifer sp. 2201CG32-9 TaxID=3232309 RepID=UPI00345BF679